MVETNGEGESVKLVLVTLHDDDDDGMVLSNYFYLIIICLHMVIWLQVTNIFLGKQLQLKKLFFIQFIYHYMVSSN